MVLKEFLADLPDETNIAVGAASGYFFLGTKAEFEQVEGRISTELLHGLVQSKAHAIELVRAMCENGIPPRRPSDVKEGQHVPGETMEEFVQRVGYDAREFTAAYKRISKNTQAIENFQPLISRQIKRTTKTALTGRVIILEGIEVGRFWNKEEYDAYEEERIKKALLRARKKKKETKNDTDTETDS